MADNHAFSGGKKCKKSKGRAVRKSSRVFHLFIRSARQRRHGLVSVCDRVKSERVGVQEGFTGFGLVRRVYCHPFAVSLLESLKVHGGRTMFRRWLPALLTVVAGIG